MPPIHWLILALILFIGEVFTFDFSLSCFGAACLAAALLSWLGFGIYWQIAALALVISLLFFTLRPLILKSLNKKASGYKSNADALLGAKAAVINVSEGNNKRAEVRIDGDVWPVLSEQELQNGQTVKVVSVEGITLRVVKED